MAYRILSPGNSFVNFNESSTFESCNFKDLNLCLPVFADDDIAFQFVIEADTNDEANDLCDLEAESVSVGISSDCSGDVLLPFSQKPERYRLSDRQVLYNWQHGLPNFKTITPVGACFFIRVDILSIYNFCSNCLQRIGNDCHTSVLEYGNEDDFAGFSYCNSAAVASDNPDNDVCDPLFITFDNQATLVVPYTAGLQAKYGVLPTIKTWIYNPGGELQNQSVFQGFDTFPPTEIRFDFGGPASGVIKIS